jgi:DNA-directed RNA polymerase specialized sigma24 family protein
LAELERKHAWRQRQQAALLARAQRRKLNAPYKEIAELLNVSVGTLGSRIKRLRDEIASAGIETIES